MNTKTRVGAAVLVGLVALGLAGCGGDTEAPAESKVAPVPAETVEGREVEATPTPTPTEDDVYGATVMNERGNSVKTLGQLAGLHSQTDVPLVQWRITAITPNFACTEQYAQPSLNGNYVALDVEVTTTPELAGEASPSFYLTEYDFSVISPDGTTENDSQGNAYSCIPEGEQLPDTFGPGEHAVGKVILDSAHTTGSIVQRYAGMPGGWEWAF